MAFAYARCGIRARWALELQGNENEVLSVLLLNVISALAALSIALLNRGRRGWKGTVVLTCSVVLILASLLSAWLQAHTAGLRHHVEAHAGEIVPPSRAGLPVILFGSDLVLGGDTLPFKAPGFPSKLPIHVLLDVHTGALVINAEIRDNVGKLAGLIQGNEWQLVSAQHDRNYNNYMFEVVSLEGSIPVLQIMHKGNVVVVSGIFFGAHETVYMAAPDQNYYGPREKADLSRLCKWFRYPSELHPGKLDDTCVARSEAALEVFALRDPQIRALLSTR